MCNDFCGAIVDTALKSDGEGVIVKKLIKMQSAVDVNMLEGSGLFGAEELEFSRPLAELISKFGKQSQQIAAEGWFINKKVFRLYTWPVRALGRRLQRRRKHSRK